MEGEGLLEVAAAAVSWESYEGERLVVGEPVGEEPQQRTADLDLGDLGFVSSRVQSPQPAPDLPGLLSYAVRRNRAAGVAGGLGRRLRLGCVDGAGRSFECGDELRAELVLL